MVERLILLATLLLKSAVVLNVLNEVRGLLLAGPVFYGIYQTGGTAMAIWLGICSLAGIALSVVIPTMAARKANRWLEQRAAATAA